MTNKNDDISKKIKYFRKLRGMTQEELSVASGIDYSQIRRYETGARNPKFDQLQSIAGALGVGVTEFVDFKLDTVGDVVSLLIELDNNSCMQWEGKKNKQGEYIPSSVRLSFEDDSINNALSLYMKYRERIRNNDSSDLDMTDEEGNVLTIEQVKGTILVNDTKIKKPRE